MLHLETNGLLRRHFDCQSSECWSNFHIMINQLDGVDKKKTKKKDFKS